MTDFEFLKINDANNPVFKDIFREYFEEIGIHLKEDTTIFDVIDKDVKEYDIQIIILILENVVIGFSMHQIDTKENPWCLSDGNGDIREFYIKKEFRYQGYGRILFNYIKSYFKNLNIEEIYLTAREVDGEAFWTKLGFNFTGIINEKNKQKEYKINIT